VKISIRSVPDIFSGSKPLFRPHREYCRGKGLKIAKAAMGILTNDHLERGMFAAISRASGIPESTLRSWRQHARDDLDWRPWHTQWGQGSRIFSDEKESEMANYIRANFLEPGLLFGDSDFKLLALQQWAAKVSDFKTMPERDFLCSACFVADFKRRNGFSSRVFHYKRRPETTDPIRVQNWIQEIQSLLEREDHDRILNCDETSWLLYPRGLLTWSDRGATSVHVHIGGDEKECFTATATITASGKKLPLQILAKGKTARVQATQLGNVADHWCDHSPSGWQTEETFGRYLQALRTWMGPGPVHLIRDLYTAHHTDHIREVAVQQEISLHFIPARMTDVLQPLDRTVFGVLKATARKYFRERCLQDPRLARRKTDAVMDLIRSWDELTPELAVLAWEISEDPWDDSTDQEFPIEGNPG
jgi:hypothetical protein